MSAVPVPLSTLATSMNWQNNFLAVLPAVQNHAAISFRHLRPEAKDQATRDEGGHNGNEVDDAGGT